MQWPWAPLLAVIMLAGTGAAPALAAIVEARFEAPAPYFIFHEGSENSPYNSPVVITLRYDTTRVTQEYEQLTHFHRNLFLPASGSASLTVDFDNTSITLPLQQIQYQQWPLVTDDRGGRNYLYFHANPAPNEIRPMFEFYMVGLYAPWWKPPGWSTDGWIGHGVDTQYFSSGELLWYSGGEGSFAYDLGLTAPDVTPVPVPPAFAFALAGVAALGWWRRRQSRTAAAGR